MKNEIESSNIMICSKYGSSFIAYKLIKLWMSWNEDLSVYEIMKGRLRGLVGSALDHRSLPPVFESGVGISDGCFNFDFPS